jgi:hypothetical protein
MLHCNARTAIVSSVEGVHRYQWLATKVIVDTILLITGTVII